VEKAENQLVIILTLHIDVVNADSTASVSENSANLDENSNCVGQMPLSNQTGQERRPEPHEARSSRSVKNERQWCSPWTVFGTNSFFRPESSWDDPSSIVKTRCNFREKVTHILCNKLI